MVSTRQSFGGKFGMEGTYSYGIFPYASAKKVASQVLWINLEVSLCIYREVSPIAEGPKHTVLPDDGLETVVFGLRYDYHGGGRRMAIVLGRCLILGGGVSTRDKG